ncbi:hypothetical protein V8D89_004160 [Ganoderma adspersum]
MTEEKYDTVSENASNLCNIVFPLLLPTLQDVINMEPVKEISSKISAIIDGIPALLSILDMVAEIHPFIKLAVGAFRVAVKLDLKCRENDKKVSLLFAAMRDMMAVLAQYVEGYQRTQGHRDGDSTIGQHMQCLIQQAAEDIKNCVNSCNAYVKKSLASKILLSGSWSDNFKKCTKCFLTRRDDFVLALLIHTGQVVNTVIDKLDATHINVGIVSDNTIAENMVHFQKDFDIRLSWLVEAVHGVARNEGNRIIAEVTYGPHNKINDPFQGPEGSSDPGAWTSKAIDATRPQAIIEAFGDEAASSGRISMEDVNTFIVSPHPEKWSLLHWLAYWAVGHQMAMTHYTDKIDTLLANMFAVKITTLTAVFRWSPTVGNKGLLNHFKAYMHACQDRLTDNLERTKYNIDGEDTLSHICGPGSIEKHVFPLLYLLLKCDLAIMQLARRECLHVHELQDLMCTVLSIFVVIDKRYEHLAGKANIWRINIYCLKVFLFEMFKYKDDQVEISKLKFQNIYNQTNKVPDVDTTSIVKYPLQVMDDLFTTHSFKETEADRNSDPVVHKILGHWTRFCGEGNIYLSQSMISLDLHVSSSNRKHFQSARTALNGTDWNLAGEYTIFEEHEAHYMFTITYTDHRKAQYFSAELDKGGTTLSGSWGYHHKPFPFIFKHLPSNVMCFYPTPAELTLSKPRVLWRFAIHATRDQVSQKRASFWWLQKRWEIGQRYARLVMWRNSEMVRLTPEEVAELSRCQCAMTWEEARLFNIFIAQDLEIQCRVCGGDPIRGSRILCITCRMADPVNLCDKSQCLNTAVYHNCAFPHRASHNILKLHTAIHPIHEYMEIYCTAQSASERLHQIFTNLPSQRGQKFGKQLPQYVVCHGYYCIQCEGNVYICVACEAKYGSITVGHHQDSHTIVQCQYIQSTMDVDCEHSAGHYSCMNERRQPIDEFLHHPLKAASALGSRATASLQYACVHA